MARIPTAAELARSLKKTQQERPNYSQNPELRIGTVTAFSGNKVYVRLDGDTLPALYPVSSNCPVGVGDRVILRRAGSTLYVCDSIAGLSLGRPMVKLVQQEAQTFNSGVTQALVFGAGSEELDTHGFHSNETNNTRITPTVPGYYKLSVTASFAAGAITQIVAGVRKNATSISPFNTTRPDPTSAASTSRASTIVSANGTTDYFEALAQVQGGTIDTNTNTGFRCVFECSWERWL